MVQFNGSDHVWGCWISTQQCLKQLVFILKRFKRHESLLAGSPMLWLSFWTLAKLAMPATQFSRESGDVEIRDVGSSVVDLDVEEFDDESLDSLRHNAGTNGLSSSDRANVWKLLLGFSSSQREAWGFVASCRRNMYHEYVGIARCALPKSFSDDLMLSAFIIYTAVHRLSSPTSGQLSRASLGKLPHLVEPSDQSCLCAMRQVLVQVYDEDPDFADTNVFWSLVMLTGRQRRIAVSQSGHFLQSFDVRHRVVAYSDLLAMEDPSLDSLIRKLLHGDHSQYVDRWFRSYFALPLAAAQSKDRFVLPRLWDALIASPFELIVHVAISFVVRLKREIQQVHSGARRLSEGETPAARTLALLENISDVTSEDIDSIVRSICRTKSGLFRRGQRIDSNAEKPISFNVQWPVLRKNSVNSSLVKVCQYLLRARHFGSIFFVADGNFGMKTQNALKRFQSHLSQLTKAQSNDNNLGSEFDRHVSGSFAASNVDYDEDVVGPELWPHLIKTLTPRSDRGCAVKALQTALKEICRFQDVRVDGYYGIITLNAVLEFQRNHAANLIDVDGVVGNLTWLHLLGDQSSDD